MSLLADFLRDQRGAILEELKRRSSRTVAPSGLTDAELADHLLSFLSELERALRETGKPAGHIFAVSANASAHGVQRLHVGYSPDGLVREYGLLSDCIYAKLEAQALTPTLRELRVLADTMSAAVADSVNQFVAHSQARADLAARQLLELFEQAPGFVCFFRGPELVFELANASYYQLVGHREILGKPVRQALPELEGQGFFELLERAYQTGEPYVGHAMPIVLQREPGTPPAHALLDFVYQPIKGSDGAVTGILSQGQDVTEARRRETERELFQQALRVTEERYRTLFESIDDGYCLMQMIVDDTGKTVDYRFLETNLAFEQHTGLKSAVGKTALELVPGLDASWFALYGHVAETGETKRFENHAPAMGDRWFDVYANRVGRPELRQVALVFKDITERRRAEEEREQLLALESVARHKAEEAGHLKDEFLATLSHELRTPLNSMLGWVHLLRTGRLAESKRERALETIERNARSQAQLIDDLLDLTRILAGKLRLTLEALDLQQVVENALDTVRPGAESKGVVLRSELAAGNVVTGDGNRLQQVVWNLLSNAVKFTPQGGQVTVVLSSVQTMARLSVSDTGRGIRSDFLPHVFERFRQQEGGSTRVHGGLGLGLSIVRQLVSLHGGDVRVESAGEGQGTRFTVELPLAEQQPVESTLADKKAVAGACPPELNHLQVLVVDDEPDAREMLRELLEECGASVRVAASAQEAFAAFRAQTPDLLLSDIGMPHEDGHALIQKIRALPIAQGRDVPAVAITAYAHADDRTRALLSGFSSHVAKPVEPFELLAVVAALAGHTWRK